MRLSLTTFLMALASSLLMTPCLFAQSSEDALRYTYSEFGGTARFNSMAGAFGAFGGDVTTAHFNPAGLGLFRSSEITISPNLTANGVDATYYGATTNDSRVGFNFDNVGLTMVYPMSKGKWKFGQFSIGYTRLMDLQSNITIGGEQAQSTFLDVAAAQASNFSPSELEQGPEGFIAWPAWTTYLINEVYGGAGDTTLLGYLPALPGDSLKEQVTRLETRGRIGETQISGAFNYDDRLYIGFGFGFQRFVDDRELVYSERVIGEIPPSFTAGEDAQLRGFDYIEDYQVSGNGVNMRVGAIYRIKDEIRVGVSYRSPTWSSFETSFDTEFASRFEEPVPSDGESYQYSQVSAQQGLGAFELTSPHRLGFSLGFVLGKKALIGVDYERVDYRQARLRSSDLAPGIDFRADNAQSRELFVDANNIRVGAEYRLMPFSLRAGAAMYTNPYNSDDVTDDAPTLIYTAGIGYRGKSGAFVDMGYRLRTSVSDYYAYDPSIVDPASLQHTDHDITLTLGTRF